MWTVTFASPRSLKHPVSATAQTLRDAVNALLYNLDAENARDSKEAELRAGERLSATAHIRNYLDGVTLEP